jgi:hypothetical protein
VVLLTGRDVVLGVAITVLGNPGKTSHDRGVCLWIMAPFVPGMVLSPEGGGIKEPEGNAPGGQAVPR